MAKQWTDAELDAVAADLVDHTIIAAGGDIRRAAEVLDHTPYLPADLRLCCLYG
jgi:hypothetical protein